MYTIKQKLKKVLPQSLKYKTYYYFGKDLTPNYTDNGKPKVFIMLAGDYGNLGDVAITAAQRAFIKDSLPDYEVLIIELSDTFKMLKTLKKIIKPTDIITIIGGGNMGDLYESFENTRRNIINSFKANKIISFPQTIDFSDSKLGLSSFTKTKNVYNSHPNLHIFARESISYDIMKSTFSKNIVNLVPDTVLSYDVAIEAQKNRDGIILCLRDDAELNLDLDAKEQLVNSIQKNYQKVSIKDTFVENVPLGFSHLNTEFENLLLDFSMSKLVITDRLHGMIFCVITGTPCIVLPNSNHKIRGTYHDWLSNLNYIKLVEDIKDLKLFNSNVEEMLDLDTKVIRKPNLYNDFELLGKALKL